LFRILHFGLFHVRQLSRLFLREWRVQRDGFLLEGFDFDLVEGEEGFDVDDFEGSVVMLDERGGAFDPVAAVGVEKGFVGAGEGGVVNFGLVDVSADDAVEVAAGGFGEEGGFEVGDEGAGGFDAGFDCGGEGVSLEADEGAGGVEEPVEGDEVVVGPGAEEAHDGGMLDDEVVFVSVGDQEGFTASGAVDGAVGELDSAEVQAGVLPEGVVVIAGDVGDVGTLFGDFEQATNDLVVHHRPAPTGAEGENVDDVADEVEPLAINMLEKRRQFRGVRTAKAEVHVGDEDGAVVESHGRQSLSGDRFRGRRWRASVLVRDIGESRRIVTV